MTRREINNKLKAAFQTLQIYEMFAEELNEQFGEEEMRRKINDKLDEINYWRKRLKKLNNE